MKSLGIIGADLMPSMALELRNGVSCAMPETWEVLAAISRTRLYSSASMPASSIALDASPTDSVASIPVASADRINWVVDFSSAFPVKPKRVLIKVDVACFLWFREWLFLHFSTISAGNSRGHSCVFWYHFTGWFSYSFLFQREKNWRAKRCACGQIG